MNLRSILLSVGLFMNAVFNAEAIMQITDPYAFQVFTTIPQAVVVLGVAQNPDFNKLLNQVASIQSQFPSVKFAWAYGNDIGQELRKFPIQSLIEVAAFKKGKLVAQAPAPVSIQNIVSKLAAVFGN